MAYVSVQTDKYTVGKKCYEPTNKSFDGNICVLDSLLHPVS